MLVYRILYYLIVVFIFFCVMCYQANECYFVRKFYLFSHLRNIIVPEI